MRIGGFAKQSFIDWTGRVAAVLFTKGCNFRCGYCHNPSLVLPELCNMEADLPVKEVLDFLEHRKNWLDGVVITGGEPTIHKDLAQLIKPIKQMGYPVKLDTNGTHPQMLQSLINENLVDSIAMDIKHLLYEDLYSQVAGSRVNLENIIGSIELIKNSGIDCQFRTTVLPEIHTIEVLQSLKNMVSPMDYTINEYKEFDGIDKIVLAEFVT